LEHYALPAQVYGVALLLARLGSFAMVMPGVGEQMVPSQIRLAFSFVLSIALFPLLASKLPLMPVSLGDMAGQVVTEIILGLAIGTLLRVFMQALAVAGEIISLQTTLSFAQTTNPLQAQPTASVTTFITLVGLVSLFVTDLHMMFLAGIVKSYTLFPAGHGVPYEDLKTLMVKTVGETFALGVQLAAPLLVFSLVFNIALGLVARVMPQFQIFFVATPLIVLLGLALFAISLGSLGVIWLDRYRAFAGQWV
jgi:flagellar biosynthetic protein FliR